MIKALQLVLSISLLVILHEGGHFLFAKLFHVKVEKFFLFFDPYFHLFSTKDKWFTRLFPKFKDKETEYGIGWLPLGGYVKIAGMIDESMDTEQMKQPMQKWEFRAKPAWQRLFIMIGGVLVNFLLALFIYAMVLFAWGESYLPMKDMKLGFQFNEQAERIGFRDGDLPLAVDGEPIKAWDANVYRSISEARQVTVLRGTCEMTLTMPEEMSMLEMAKANPPFLVPMLPAVIDSVVPDSPAGRAGMGKGCLLTAIDGRSVETWTDFDVVMQECFERYEAAPSDSERERLRQVTVAYRSDTATVADTVTLVLTEDFKMGVIKRGLQYYYKPVQVDYGFLASIPAGISHGIGVLAGYVSDLKYLATSEGINSVGSFGTIGSIFPATWNWPAFWEITAFISLMLAFMNILPIPALDGGHVLFLIAEMILRRPPSEKFLERAQMVGMTLLICLMVFACYRDIVRFLL